VKNKGEDFESCEKIKARTLSPMKDKSKVVESYETSQYEHDFWNADARG